MPNPAISWQLRMHELRGSKNVTQYSGMSELIFLHKTGKHYLEPKINCHCMIYKCQCYLSTYYRLGAGGLDFREFSQQEDLYTGGLGVSPHITDHHTDSTLLEEVRSTGQGESEIA